MAEFGAVFHRINEPTGDEISGQMKRHLPATIHPGEILAVLFDRSWREFSGLVASSERDRFWPYGTGARSFFKRFTTMSIGSTGLFPAPSRWTGSGMTPGDSILSPVRGGTLLENRLCDLRVDAFGSVYELRDGQVHG